MWPFDRQPLPEAREEFHRIIDAELQPILAEQGFSGRRPHWRRIRGPVVCCVNLQGSKYGDECCVNLGVHLTFLPPPIPAEPVPPEQLKEHDCEFRRRLRSNDRYDHWWAWQNGDQWWKYRPAAKQAQALIASYRENAGRFFHVFDDFPQPFAACNVEWVRKHSPYKSFAPRMFLVLARVHRYLGNTETAAGICRVGLEAGNWNTSLKEQLMQELESAAV